MEQEKLDELIRKYEEGMATLEEEQALEEYFRNNPFPEKHRGLATLFEYYIQTRSATHLGEAFDNELLEKLSQKQRKPFLSPVLFYRIAASVLILLGSFIAVKFYTGKEAIKYATEIRNEQQAYEETRKALLLVSSQLNRGKVYAQQLGRINEAEKKAGYEN